MGGDLKYILKHPSLCTYSGILICAFIQIIRAFLTNAALKVFLLSKDKGNTAQPAANAFAHHLLAGDIS